MKLGWISWLVLWSWTAFAADANRPNILFIMSDDHAAHAISSYGSRVNATPQLDRLGRQGVRFEHCYAVNSICTPSRATILTGKYSHLNGTPVFNMFDGSQPTVSKMLQAGGYYTAMIGKWHLGSKPTGFDYWNILPGQGRYEDPILYDRDGARVYPGYATDVITDLTIDVLKHRPKDKPFFVMCHHKAPHREWIPDEKHRRMFAGQIIPEPATLRDTYEGRTDALREQQQSVFKDMTRRDLKLVPPGGLTPKETNAWLSAKPDKVEVEIDGVKKTLAGDELDRWKYQRYMQDYLACIQSIDDNVGRLLDWLDTNGLGRNTLVIYTSDQGFFLGDHGLYDKRFMYEESIRMPFLARWPDGIKPGTIVDALAINCDFAPTFLELAGLPIPADMQGRSLLPLCQGRRPDDWRTAFYYRYYHDPGHHHTRAHYGVRTETHKLIHYWKADQWECYDLGKDPEELKNIYSDPEAQPVVQQLKATLARLKHEVKDHDQFTVDLPKDGVDGPPPPMKDIVQAREARLEREFANPPAEDRILKIIHNWPDDPKAQDELRARLLRQGFGGVVCNVSFNDYLESDTKWQAFVRAVHAAKKDNMALWLYDERGYPSAAAGGLVLRDHPEWEARGLFIAEVECGTGLVNLKVPPGTLALCAAFPVENGVLKLGNKVDLTSQVKNGAVQWQAPAGSWHVMAVTEDKLYEGTHAEMNLAAKQPYPNLLLREPTARFLELTHDRYAQQLGKNLGKYFEATFTDEPSLMSYFLRPMPYRVLPWSQSFDAEFKKRRGYDLAPFLPALVGNAGTASSQHRYAFWLTVGELVSENFFGQIQAWCREHKIPSGGHLLMEESLVSHVPFYGDFFRCARRLDAPSIDCLTSLPPQVPWSIARLLASAAELEGQTLVMSETSDHIQHYRPAGDQRPRQPVSEAEIRGTCNRLIVSGVNTITSYYSFDGLNDEALKRLNEWVGRCCRVLRGGHQVAEIALLYPIESLWTRFRPSRHNANDAPDATRIENTYHLAMDAMFNARREFTIIDSRTLMEADATIGKLEHRNFQWRVLVLPGVDTLPLAAWENLARFVRQGGVVIALGALPLNSESEFPSGSVRAMARELFPPQRGELNVRTNAMGGAAIFLSEGAEGLLAAVLDNLLAPELKLDAPRAPLRMTHRRIDGHEVYFVINDSGKPWQGLAELASSGLGEEWDIPSGRRMRSDLGPRLQVRLEPYGAVLYRFPEAGTLRRATPGDVLPELGRFSLPDVEPVLAPGDQVQAKLVFETGSRSWKASATLKKGNVDTWLFARMLYPEALDLRERDCLRLQTWVPAGQGTPNQLLVILREKNGGEFYAHTGRALGKPGRQVTVVPFNRFELAGWSKDADGELDLSRVDEIRIGWGGYYGAEGERIEFEFTAPEAGAVRTASASK